MNVDWSIFDLPVAPIEFPLPSPPVSGPTIGDIPGVGPLPIGGGSTITPPDQGIYGDDAIREFVEQLAKSACGAQIKDIVDGFKGGNGGGGNVGGGGSGKGPINIGIDGKGLRIEIDNKGCKSLPKILQGKSKMMLEPDGSLHLRGIQLTPPTTTCSMRGHGRLPANDLGVGGAVPDGRGLSGVFAVTSLADRVCLSSLPDGVRMACDAWTGSLPGVPVSGLGDSAPYKEVGGGKHSQPGNHNI